MIYINKTAIQMLEPREIADMDELAFVSATMKGLAQNWPVQPLPDWLVAKQKEIDREMIERQRGEIERQLKNMKARRAALATPDEKRKTLDEQIAALEAKLA